MKKIVLASGNAGKIRELSAILQSHTAGIGVLGLDDFPDIGAIAETGTTFEDNARIKAKTVAQATGLVAIADDSGLSVDALDGAPGIHSARYSGANATDEKNIVKLLEAMREVPDCSRGCSFICVMVAMTPDGHELIARGEWRGQVTRVPVGQQGFGYDPIFFDEELGITAAQMEAAIKNARSHRGKAVQELLHGWPEFWALALQELKG